MEVIVLFNKKMQKYDVLGRFRINTGNGEVDFARVKFMMTKHEQIVPAVKLATGDFEDESIVTEPTPVKPVVINKKEESKVYITEESVEEVKKEIENFESVKETPVEVPTPTSFDIIATNPKGKEITINSLELEKFCADNKLDLEAVNAVINGEQKTHRKWKFEKVEVQ